MHIPPGAWIAVCLSIRTATAFYPYEWKDGGDSTGKVRRTVRGPRLPTPENRRSITLPLRRVHRPRDNIYNIVNSNDPSKKNSVAIDQDGNDLSYMVAVTVGDSKEEYHLLLDSAASNTWIMGQDCKSDACGTHALFGEGDSSTLKVSFKILDLDFSFLELEANPMTADGNNSLFRNIRHRQRVRHNCL